MLRGEVQEGSSGVDVSAWRRWQRLISAMTRRFVAVSPTTVRLRQARAGLKAALARLPDRVTHS
jgi:hypothetical protein